MLTDAEFIEQMSVLLTEAKICQVVDRQDELSIALDAMGKLLEEYQESVCTR